MKFLVTIFLPCLLFTWAFSQTAKPKSATPKPKTAASKANPTDKKNKTAAKKPTVNKPTAAASKKKTATAKAPKISSSAPKNKPSDKTKKTSVTKKQSTTASKNASNSKKHNSNPPKPKATVSKSIPVPVPETKPDEKVEWETAIAIPDADGRVTALKKFIGAFPASTRNAEAIVIIVNIETAVGNDKLTAGDVAGAAALYKTAVNDAPKPVPDQLFTSTFAKALPNLFFRGARGEAFELAKALEDKSDASVPQLLSIANFYMSVENGTEARRIAHKAVILDPNSSLAYQALGLANRIDFQLEDSAAAYSKALELEPDSLSARRGLAEMKRSLGKADEAVVLYREILTKDESDLPAQTGLTLSLFDAGKLPDAEASLKKSLDANPGNVIMLAGTAYWYAAHNDGDKAISLAQQAIAADPRFIWSHIALARGYMSLKQPMTAEKTLLAARRYGNFPTLEYEIASARLAAGFFREAAEELVKSFSVKDGLVHTNLGGRVPRDLKNFTELVGFERRASIFAPTAADNPENAAKLLALLALKQELDSAESKPEAIAKAADEFVKGDDKMRVHRLLFTASQMLEKKAALPKVLELVKEAPQSLDTGLEIQDAAAAVMASELYENRAIANARGEYLNLPGIPISTLSAILRGRIEEIGGWAYYQMDDPAQAAIHLKRAVSILPADSAWWRSSTWRLGSALSLGGKEAEALDFYIRSYKSGTPDVLRYNVIEALYKRLNGSSEGLEARIGANPASGLLNQTVAQMRPVLRPDTTPVSTPEPTPAVEKILLPGDVPRSVPIATPIPAPRSIVPSIEPTPTPPIVVPTPISTPEAAPISTPTTEPQPTATPLIISPTPIPTPVSTPDVKKAASTPEPLVLQTPEPTPTSTTLTIKPVATPDPGPTPTQTPSPVSTPDITKEAANKAKSIGKELFPPVVITIPQPDVTKSTPREPLIKPIISPTPDDIKTDDIPKPIVSPMPEDSKLLPEIKPLPTPPSETGKKPYEPIILIDGRPRIVEIKPATTSEISPCTLTVSEESVSLQNGGGDLAIIVGQAEDGDLEGLKAISTSPENITVRREVIGGVRTRALFVVRSITPKAGVYQVRFEMPCGKKEIVVRVK